MRLYLVISLLIVMVCPVFGQAKYNYALNRACYQSSAFDYNQTAQLATDGDLSTGWRSKSAFNEWICVDLGSEKAFQDIVITFDLLYAKEFKLYVTNTIQDNQPAEWSEVYHSTQAKPGKNIIQLKTTKARYLKLLGISAYNPKGFKVNELEVFGNKKPETVIRPEPPVLSNGYKYLTGGNWKIRRASQVDASGEQLSADGGNAKNWLPAIVPGTVLASYIDQGAVPDPNYSDWQLCISDSFFTAPFWYVNHFNIPASFGNKTIWLNFDGINYKADIYFNGHFIGAMKGAFVKNRFNITPYAKPGTNNGLAVLVYPNEHPGKVTQQHLNDPDGNGGIIGLDGPTFLSSIGWNWMPTIRGRNSGIWNDVYLNATRQVTLSEPFVITDLHLPDTTKAYLSLQFKITNHSHNACQSLITVNFAGAIITDTVTLIGGEEKTITWSWKDNPQWIIEKPALWWPNGYGNPYLYNMVINADCNGEPSDRLDLKVGIRKYTYTYDQNRLRLNINGYPLIIRGGNWGMAESMLRCDSAGYDLRVRLHKEMNLNMIRNWIGMTADDEFYNACDKYGMMVWDDFWLANPVDGPTPADHTLFMDNARSKVVQRRNNASVALWVGRNEGFPPAVIDSALQTLINELDPTRHYISSSAHSPASGLGPYEIKDPKWYFTHRGTTLHSEQGIVAVPSAETMHQMLPADKCWPINDFWGLHDWTQPRVQIYTDDLIRQYGPANSLEEFCRKARFMNTEGPKAMMETWQCNRGGGILVWMTHPAWPSLICQTYDYYFEPTAAFFAIKKGSEPLHILWRADNEQVVVANNTLRNLDDLHATIRIFNLNGKPSYQHDTVISIAGNSTVIAGYLPYPDSVSRVHFIKLTLTQNGKTLSDNFYWRSTKYTEYNDLNQMEKATIEASVIANTNYKTVVNIHNTSDKVALMLRLKVIDAKTNQRILPVIYSDNYLSLIPGESKKVSIGYPGNQSINVATMVTIEGWNTEVIELNIPSK